MTISAAKCALAIYIHTYIVGVAVNRMKRLFKPRVPRKMVSKLIFATCVGLGMCLALTARQADRHVKNVE